MQIYHGGLQGLEEASLGKCVVIIDVFRAATTACVAFARGAKAVLPVASLEELALRCQQYPDALVLGEREGKPVAQSAVGNSPTLLYQAHSLRDKIVLHASHAGTRGLRAAEKGGAAMVLFAGFVNASATVALLRQLEKEEQSPRKKNSILLVPMGWAGEVAAPEDQLCARFLADLLEEKLPSPSFAEIRKTLLYGEAGKRFTLGNWWAPEDDLEYCLALDSMPFALQLESSIMYPCSTLSPQIIFEQSEQDPAGRLRDG